mmetsp:Transcript_13314/g.42212  ORF Transcript_13314/g.42212 Transcript_13314/m.42212 type:complete len:416 (-) Transcript_13314:137-1384(-)
MRRDSVSPNSELLVAPLKDPSQRRILLPHRRDVKLEDVVCSEGHLAVFERAGGLQRATIHELPAGGSAPPALGKGLTIDFPDAAYELGAAGHQGPFQSPVLRLSYSSLATPTSAIDYDMETGEREVKKIQPVRGGYDPADYATERIWATSRDGTKIPISLVYRKGAASPGDRPSPLLLDGYGSYEICNDPYFSSSRLCLLDRGFVFAIAHVRGGGEMGRSWYEDGKYLQKKNTFHDFICCAEHLVANGYTAPDRLCIEGRSAGGLTMGAVLNMRPDLFQAAICGVPFVDVLTTMLDETIPLTVIEWEEWGNPSDEEFYHYMKSYSPMDNVARQDYPNILITSGLHDPRVAYWEPAKFAAALRDVKTDSNLLLHKCDMSAGHFSQSGRFDRLKEVAFEHAFLLKCVGLAGKAPSKL